MERWAQALFTHSSTRESILEHRFLAAVAGQLWQEGEFDLAVSHSEVDNAGHDVIIEARGVVRHIQLKALHLAGRARRFPIQKRLEEKASGCVVLMRHDLRTLEITRYGFYGGVPGEKMPTLDGKVAKHTKADSSGSKAERPGLRLLPLSSFEAAPDAQTLTRLLFGEPGLRLGPIDKAG
ncbi:MAG: hypothetical protein KKD64_04035 [Alphaproteobacteria bacterium]|nr:hypothetical protein [Alphaproteobacteria bacterium]MBU0795005.1 hypothetical protein [Alphaproteobacteria bacterium]MBU0875053.1 hypothetical protein [Alphaproteobacteria bacterium]MBU1768802.1 hypothetical protein [Alphaproteobacteria bacterium]